MVDSDDGRDAPVADDITYDDLEFNPSLEPKSAKAWINLLDESRDTFKDYNDHCDRIEERLASLARLSNLNRDKEFQIFWANMEVIKPAVYAQPPVPVVTTKFKDRRPVPTAASEFVERCAIVSFDLADIDELMLLVRDDLVTLNRGVAWCRYEDGKDDDSYYSSERVCIDFKQRRDFLHSISRNWRETTWVAAASYLTRDEARERFHDASGDEYQRAEYRVDKDSQEVGGADARERACFWEIWDKNSRRVVWVAEGCENILDEDKPHLDLRNYFPCPKPAYGCVQRGSLVPVPDVMQYRDQLEEIDMLTGRIHALSDAIEVKGFYPAGGGEVADAVNAALAIKTPGRVLVPISNWAAFGNTNEVIIWMPIDMISQVITGLVALRKQVIDDIYQITGLADIMRGDTDPRETLGAQQIKTQYGTTRIRDKQMELARFAKDLVEIAVEIMSEKFQPATLIEMSQTQLPTNRMVEQQAREIMMQLQAQQQQIKMVGASPQGQQMQQAQPEMASQAADQGQLQIEQGFQALDKLRRQPTVEQVITFLKDNRVRAFVLDIETDSTILTDENQEKQRRTEFVQALGQLLPQLAQMIAADPKTADFCGQVLKFATAPYRAGRELMASIDDLIEQMKAKGDQPQGPDATTAANQTAIQIEQMKLQAQRESDAGKMQLEQAKLQMQDRHQQQKMDQDFRIAIMGVHQDGAANQSDIAIQGMKMRESQATHQADIMSNIQKQQLEREKAQHQMMQAGMRDEMAQRAAMVKAMQPQVAPVGPVR